VSYDKADQIRRDRVPLKQESLFSMLNRQIVLRGSGFRPKLMLDIDRRFKRNRLQKGVS